jgi:hypothetical protein
VATWKLRNIPGQATWDPIRPPKGSGGLQALYWGTQIRNQINPLGGMDLIADRSYLILLPSGQAYRDLPPGGNVLDMDFARAVQDKPRLCGTYSIHGNQLVFDWLTSYGLMERDTMAFTGTGKDIAFT